MGIEEFSTSEEQEDPPEPVDVESVELPEHCSVWTTEDNLLAMVEIDADHFREHVSTETKDRAKEKDLIFLDQYSSESKVVFTDDLDEFDQSFHVLGVEHYLKRRMEEMDDGFY